MSLMRLFEDPWLVAVDKPEGLLMHPSAVDPTERDTLLTRLSRQLGQKLYPLHRLDRATSGLVLLAKQPETAAALSLDWQQGRVRKQYLAIVRGYPEAAGVIDHPLGPVRDERAAIRGGGTPQAATSHYWRLARLELPVAVDKYASSRYALMALEPVTGRRHQLRRHMKHISHPLIGDIRYGKGTHNRFFASEFDCPRLLLHARQLRFIHPVSLQPMQLDCPVTGAFGQLLQHPDWLRDAEPDFDREWNADASH